MKYIIDRFEGDFAVVELIVEKRTVNIPKIALPSETKEGDVINVQIDRSETENRKINIEGKLKMMLKQSE